MLIPTPENIGLTDKEATLYELLLNNGEKDAGFLITASKLKRPTVYKSLYNMEAKGLITQSQKEGKAFFRPEPPEKLIDLSRSRMRELESTRNDLSALMPILNSAFTLSTERPIVTTFQGVVGLKQIYQDMLKMGKPIQAALYTGEVQPELFQWLTGEFSRKRVELGIPVQSIVASGGWADEYERRNTAELRETRLIDSTNYNLKHEIDIFGDKVSLIDFQKGGSLIGIVINHPAIANSMRAWFKLTWESLG